MCIRDSIAGVWELLSGHMSTGILIVAQSLVAVMLAPVGSIVNAGIEMQALKGETARTNDVMHYAQDSKFLDDETQQKEEMDGEIELQNVSFGYSPLDEPLIKNFYLRIKKGGSVAITGESGSGKSTIAKMIAGLYGEDGGTVTFNGMARNKINHYYFYSKIAVVSQNIRLFEGSVIDNITTVSYTHLSFAWHNHMILLEMRKAPHRLYQIRSDTAVNIMMEKQD